MSWFRSEYRLITKSGFFDPVFYLIKYPDVRVGDVNPLRHFLKFGWKEGRQPSAEFDTRYYLENNPDVRASGVNPLVHYLLHGRAEGRLPRPGAMSGVRRTPAGRSPAPTTRDRISGISLQSVRGYAKVYGLRRTIHKAREVMFPGSAYGNLEKQTQITIEKPVTQLISTLPDEILTTLDLSVSVIIPTKNAGPDFLVLLKMLANQQGLSKVEIVVVDSGSQDETLSLAEDFGARIVRIAPEAFTHSYARNIGAQNATGDFLLFTVQDALPPSTFWIYEMLQVLLKNDVAAVSCAETPREDADLFYRQICWNHYNFLGINETDRIFSLPEKMDHISLRQNAQLSDLACLINRDLFSEYGYRRDYAEDLDLGLRLIKSGKKIAFLGSIRVIHSHNRLPYYFLKRGYVDNLFLSDMFEDFVIPRISLADFVPDVAYTYRFLSQLLGQLDRLVLPIGMDQVETLVRQAFSEAGSGAYPDIVPNLDPRYLDQHAIEFLGNLIRGWGMNSSGKTYSGFLITAFMGYVNITLAYLRNTYELMEPELLEEVKGCLHKAFCILTGAHLAYCYRNRNARDEGALEQMGFLLKEGV
jgi:glycosyltransferase involved in cell wall biosynthesis